MPVGDRSQLPVSSESGTWNAPGRGALSAVAAFVALACLLSWAWVVPQVVAGLTVRPGQGWPTHFPALLGPLLASLAVTGWFYRRTGLRDLVRRMLRVRVGWRWWLAAVSPLGILAVGLGVQRLLGQPWPTPTAFGRISGVPAAWGVVGVAVVIFVVNGFGEEAGWRGFAVAHLQTRFSPLVSALLVVPPWALWHVPQFALLESFRGFSPAVVVGWVLGLTCGSVVLTWLYNRSGGSIPIVAVWHTLYNIVGGTEAAQGFLAAFVATVIMAGALALVGAHLWARRRGGRSPLEPADPAWAHDHTQPNDTQPMRPQP